MFSNMAVYRQQISMMQSGNKFGRFLISELVMQTEQEHHATGGCNIIGSNSIKANT